MPLYDYRCLDCDDKFEVLAKNSLEEVSCPSCGSKNVKRLISSFSFATTGTELSSNSAGCATCTSRSCSTCK